MDRKAFYMNPLSIPIKRGRISPNSLPEGGLVMRTIDGDLYLYTKHNGVLYKTLMNKDNINSNMTDKEKRKFGALEKSQSTYPGVLLSMHGYADVATKDNYYRTRGGLITNWSDNDSTPNLTEYYQTECNYITPVPLRVKEIHSTWYYTNASMDDAVGSFFIAKIPVPANTATGTTITAQQITDIEWYAAQNHNTVYTKSTVPSKKVGTSLLDAGDGIMIYMKRTSGSSTSNSLYVTISIYAEYI